MEESEWIRHGPDLAALSHGSQHGWLNGAIEDVLSLFSTRFTTAVFRSREQAMKAGNEHVQLLSPQRVESVLCIFLTIVAAMLLLAPVCILFELQPVSRADIKRKSTFQILTIFLFTLACSASCSIFTKARRQEVFTATAAYCAVLVVLLGNTSNIAMAPTGIASQNGN